ncbi:UV-endonuclease UvdE, partial [Gaertneriomyces semiglobifer]
MPPQPSQQFRGRLGYACLNTVLRAQQPPIFQSRTCRMATIVQNGVSHAHALGVQNAKDIIPMLHWNEAHNIRFLRLSSEMFPFASHEVHGYNIADVPGAKEVLKEVGEVARRLGHRLTMHPGQFTQLASPRPEVVRNAIRDLEYHCQILDLLGADQDSVLIIHMGGVYGDKPATIARFHENWATVPPHIQKRVVLENDEICYSVEDLLPTCEKFQIPLVLDWHHDSILPSSLPTLDYIPRINAIWHARGIKVKQHYSEGRPGAVTPMQRRAHSDRVVQMPPCEPDVDLMIEAKDKEMAVLGLMRVLG